MMQCESLILAVVLMATSFSATSADFWDSVPVVSQVKSAVQAVSGNMEGARETQENFINQAPILSQVKSAVQIASGDRAGARETQKQFLHEFVEPVADNTPGVGHVRGSLHILAGDSERGEKILRRATSATAGVVGGLLGGFTGAVAGVAASDVVITGLNSMRNGKFAPVGIVDYVTKNRQPTKQAEKEDLEPEDIRRRSFA